MNILDIYFRYRIPSQLQQHQLRVAGVAKLICNSIISFGESREVIIACLLHDMGNIIRFKLEAFPEFLEPEGLMYWQRVKDEFIQRYGNDEHTTTYEIAKELKVDDRIFELIHGVGITKAIETSKKDDVANKIVVYCDQRVSPTGVVPLLERVMEGYERKKLDKRMLQNDEAKFKETVDALKKIEEDIFSKSSLEPDNINDEDVNKVIPGLKTFEI